jgi:hypothetical protein
MPHSVPHPFLPQPWAPPDLEVAPEPPSARLCSPFADPRTADHGRRCPVFQPWGCWPLPLSPLAPPVELNSGVAGFGIKARRRARQDSARRHAGSAARIASGICSNSSHASDSIEIQKKACLISS